MIVTCPGCETKYEVIEDALIPNGRILRCVRCGHKWTQRPPVSENYPNELSEELTDNDFSGNDDESEDDSIRSFEDSGNDDDDYEGSQGNDQDDDDDDDDDDVPRKRRGLIGKLIKLLFLIIILAIIFFGVILNRGRIVDLWKPSSVFYELSFIKQVYKINMLSPLFKLPFIDIDIDKDKDIGPQGLLLLPPETKQEVVNDKVMVKISGVVSNPSKSLISVPKVMQVVLLDSNNETLQVRDFSSPVEKLEPGQSFNYLHSFDDSPKDVTGMLVRFKGYALQEKNDDNKNN